MFQNGCLSILPAKNINLTYVFRCVDKMASNGSKMEGCHHKLSVHNHSFSFYPNEDVTGDLALRKDAYPFSTVFL